MDQLARLVEPKGEPDPETNRVSPRLVYWDRVEKGLRPTAAGSAVRAAYASARTDVDKTARVREVQEAFER